MKAKHITGGIVLVVASWIAILAMRSASRETRVDPVAGAVAQADVADAPNARRGEAIDAHVSRVPSRDLVPDTGHRSGRIRRVGVGADSTAVRRPGQVFGIWVDGESRSELSVPVVDGEWRVTRPAGELRVNPDVTFVVTGVALDIGPVSLVSATELSLAGQISFAWSEASWDLHVSWTDMNLAVLDGHTREPIRDASVYSLAPAPAPLPSTRHAPPIPSGALQRVIESTPSPIALSYPLRGHAYLVTAPGYCWARVTPYDMIGSRCEALLYRAGSLSISVSGDAPPKDCSLYVYRVDSESTGEPQVAVPFPPSGVAEIAPIAAGSYRVILARTADATHTPLAEGAARVAPGEVTRVTLEWRAHPGSVTCTVRLELDGLFEPDPTDALDLVVVGGPLDATAVRLDLAEAVLSLGARRFEWERVELPIANYLAYFAGLACVRPAIVEADSRAVVVRLDAPCEVSLGAVDSQSGARIEFDAMIVCSWGTAVADAGELPNWGGGKWLSGRTGSVRLRCPPGRLDVQCSAPGYGFQSTSIQVAVGGGDYDVELVKRSELRVTVVDLADQEVAVDPHWAQAIQFHDDAGLPIRVTGRSSRSTVTGGGTRLVSESILTTTHVGRVQVHVPQHPDWGATPSITVELVPGSVAHARIRVGRAPR